jgi:uncharacterized protein with LGFP repeats
VVAYNSLAEAHRLYEEQARLNAALDYLDGGGKVVSVTVLPPAPREGQFPQMAGQMAIGIEVTDASNQLADAVRAVISAKYEALRGKLNELGVTDTPERKDEEQ